MDFPRDFQDPSFPLLSDEKSCDLEFTCFLFNPELREECKATPTPVQKPESMPVSATIPEAKPQPKIFDVEVEMNAEYICQVAFQQKSELTDTNKDENYYKDACNLDKFCPDEKPDVSYSSVLHQMKAMYESLVVFDKLSQPKGLQSFFNNINKFVLTDTVTTQLMVATGFYTAISALASTAHTFREEVITLVDQVTTMIVFVSVACVGWIISRTLKAFLPKTEDGTFNASPFFVHCFDVFWPCECDLFSISNACRYFIWEGRKERERD
jgi:hypothetical protein